MTSSDPSGSHRAAADRTWGGEPGRWVTAIVGTAAFGAVFVALLVAMFGRDSFALFAALWLAALVWIVTGSLREAYRVTLYRDGTVEMVRPIGTVRIRVDQVRVLRLVHWSEGGGPRTLRVRTDRGRYLVRHDLDDVHGMADALRERNPGIDLRGF